ncbi:MAG: hypothetical protein M1830_004523, partial [Pleopsidium flavum]
MFPQKPTSPSHPVHKKEEEKASTHNLRLPPTLHKRLFPAILGNSVDIIRKAACQTREREEPEDQAEGEGEAFFDGRGLGLEVEGDDDGDGDDGE